MGIFYANFLQYRDHWKACQEVCFGKCYKAPECEDHRGVHPQDEEEEEDRGRHIFARKGYHLLIPLQRVLCHYRNLNGIDPTGVKVDDILLSTIRRVNLGSFWSRESWTV